jgi:hypothetical protein
MTAVRTARDFTLLRLADARDHVASLEAMRDAAIAEFPEGATRAGSRVRLFIADIDASIAVALGTIARLEARPETSRK